ncbi:MAG: hypothetical protein IJO31_07155 [Oscillospiraceae bacterium]|nr:hypothetical protein [Oscillospiraceae bacterium]
MENTFVVNIIHRPELSPEYAEKALGKGKGVRDESLDIFRFQQDCAHKYGLKTTIQITYASLFSDVIIEMAKADHETYGDEIGLSLLGLPCPEFKAKYHTEDFCIWMFDEKTKEEIIDDVFGKFYEAFGFYPQSTSSYFLDAYTINYIKKQYPSVKCAVATCWEEGPKAYHTCNNSWYTFMDGGPWNPWIPSKVNSHCPAADSSDDSGIVAIPHLSRDLMACFDGNGSNFGTHPQNVLRGMIYYNEAGEYEYPYLYNLIDQYRHLGKYNDGYSYNMMFVGPGWLNRRGRWEAPYELLAKSYDDGMKYYGKLKAEGKLLDMTMAEFADFYRQRHPDYNRGECALWKDILYGSNKEYFWYADPNMRTCLDFNQGGAIIDLRPYAARIPQNCGIGTENVYDASYPYLIQINYRAGYFTHYAGAGTVKSCKVSYHGETADLCLCRTMAVYEKIEGGVRLTADPVTVTLDGLDIVIQSVFTIEEGTGRIVTERNILNDLGGAEVALEEYFTGGFGTTEYQADMTDLTLGVDEDAMAYTYHGKKLEKANAASAYVTIPAVCTKVEMGGDNDVSMVEEGIAFSPVYHIALKKTVSKGGFTTWLKLQKAN